MLGPVQVADVYLSRWANQENVYRNGRNGAGLEHSHGYGGEHVIRARVQRKTEEAESELARAQKALAKAREQESQAEALSRSAADEHQEAADRFLKEARRKVKKSETRRSRAEAAKEAISRYPEETFQRDTTRENIATSLTLMVMRLIEHFVRAPVTVRTTFRRILYQLESNPRNPERTEQLRTACEEINRRRIRKDGRLLKFEVVDPFTPESG